MPWMAILDIYMPFGRHKYYTFSRVFYIHVAWIPAPCRNDVDFICVDSYASGSDTFTLFTGSVLTLIDRFFFALFHSRLSLIRLSLRLCS